MRLVLASNNAKKLTELKDLFHGLDVELITQGELGIGEADEPHISFIENALAKARHAAAAAGCAAIADDSGVCVDAIGGEPGVVSAHFAGHVQAAADREATRRMQDAANNRLLLQRLQGLHGNDERSAFFVSTLVAVRHAQDPQPLVATGRWPGLILRAPRGEFGFGYDPLMFIPEFDRTVAEMDAALKNAHSHRARAAAQMRMQLRDIWRL